MNLFKKDKYHFIKYFSLNAVLFLILNFLLIKFHSINLNISFNLLSVFFIISGLVLGLVSATAFHNASHGNIKPKILNTIVGELTANFSLEDMRCFRVGHMLHHMHVDDDNLDPHPPKGLTFLEFITQSRQRTIKCISNLYYSKHGRTEKSILNVKAQIVIFHIVLLLKLVFWFLLFGPYGFVYFYIPSYLSYFFGFAHLNYVSHQELDGEVQVHNHNEGLILKFMNILTSGGYFHKNHHISPGLYNPSKLAR